MRLNQLSTMSASENGKPQVKQEGERGASSQSSENSKATDGGSQNKTSAATPVSSNAPSNAKDAKVCCIFD